MIFKWQNRLFNNSIRFFAASEKQLKQRLKAITSIEKITKAMKMVAASKVKFDVQRLDNGKSFGYYSFDTVMKSDTYLQKRPIIESKIMKTLLIPITTDKGFCGGINSSIIRELRTFINEHDKKNIGIFTLGEKGISACMRAFPECLIYGISQTANPLNALNVSCICEEIGRVAENYDNLIFYYNEYKNSITYLLRTIKIHPKKKFKIITSNIVRYEKDIPEGTAADQSLFDLYFFSNLYHAILHNAASEQSARMNSMTNANKNAGEFAEKLNRDINKARQAHITMELCEIISGASVL